MPASLPAVACQASLSPGPPPFPPPLLQLISAGRLHPFQAFKPALASASAPLQLKWTSSRLPAFPVPRGQCGCSRLSQKQPRSCRALLQHSLLCLRLAAGKPGQLLDYSPPPHPPRVAHFADHLRCRANSVLNPIVSLPSSPRSLA